MEIMGCSRLAPQTIGGEGKLPVNWIKHFLSAELQFVIIHDLGVISIIKYKLLCCDLKFSLRVQMQLVGTHNSMTCTMCQPCSNGTNVALILCIYNCIVYIENLIEEHFQESKTYCLSCLRSYLNRWTTGHLTPRWCTYWSTC